MKIIKHIGQSPVFAGVILIISLSAPPAVLAQALEEIVVTAQRREQSLQDVPISIETISGDQIIDQGYRNLDELADFVPGMVMEHDVEEQSLVLRGQGTQTKNLVQENAIPIFIDGVSFARMENIRATFLDIERMEVLRGPQPVYFGQSARAGAISVTTKKPTPTWEGDVMLELGNQSERTIEVAAGGPITDTLGIRVAGRLDKSDGFLRDVITDKLIPERDYQVGRVTLQWAPMDDLTVTGKFEYSTQRAGADTWGISPREGVATEDLSPNDALNYFALGIEGVGFVPVEGPAGWTRRGITSNPPYFTPDPRTGANGDSSGQIRRGVLDFTHFVDGDLNNPIPREAVSIESGAYANLQDQLPVPERLATAKFGSVLESDLWHAMLNVNYMMDNDIEVNSITAYAESDYRTMRGLAQPFNTNPRHRTIDFDMWSQELRVSSPVGGAIEWMVGLYWQRNNPTYTGNTWRANLRRQIAGSRTSEDSEWRAAFATLTYNFMDNKASVDLGARYTDISKVGKGVNYTGQWVLEDLDNPGELIVFPLGIEIKDDRDDDNNDTIPDNQQHPVFGNLERYNVAQPVGRTPIVTTDGVAGEINNDHLDPQVVFRYRPTDNISTYAKWARATLAGSFEAGVTGITDVPIDFVVGPEEGIIWEAGVRGSFMDGRLDASATIFRNDVSDLQVTALDRVADRRRTINAGKLRTEGLEAGGRFQITDSWRANLSMAFVKSKYLEFDGAVCSETELEAGACYLEQDSQGNDRAVLDRTGQRGPDAPKYHLVLGTSYTLPFWDNYKAVFNVQGSTRQFYTGNQTLGLDESDHREELNLAVTVGDMAESWTLKLYGRNVLESRPTLLSPDDIPDDPTLSLRTTSLNPKDFGSYGLQFRYHFR